MSDWSRNAATLLRSGRRAFRPTASDRARVLLALVHRLGDGTLLNAFHARRSARAVASTRRLGPGGGILGGAAALAIGAALVSASHPRTTANARPAIAVTAIAVTASAPARPPSFAPTAWTPASDPSLSPAEDGLAPPTSATSHVGRSSSAAPTGARRDGRPASDSLKEEVRLLERAERDLRDGDPRDALSALGEHEDRFPRGALAEERVAARVDALCALGRTIDARTERSRLAASYPQSAHLSATARSCVDRRLPAQ